MTITIKSESGKTTSFTLSDGQGESIEAAAAADKESVADYIRNWIIGGIECDTKNRGVDILFTEEA